MTLNSKKIIAFEGPSNSGKTTLINKLGEFCTENDILFYVLTDYHDFSLELNLKTIELNAHLDFEKTENALQHFLNLEKLRFQIIEEFTSNFDYFFLDRSFLTLLAHLKAIYNLKFLSLEKFKVLESRILEFSNIVTFKKIIILDIEQNILAERDTKKEYGIFSSKDYNQEFSSSILSYKVELKSIKNFLTLKNNNVSINLFKNILIS
jgi:thymidylate kinase